MCHIAVREVITGFCNDPMVYTYHNKILNQNHSYILQSHCTLSSKWHVWQWQTEKISIILYVHTHVSCFIELGCLGLVGLDQQVCWDTSLAYMVILKRWFRTECKSIRKHNQTNGDGRYRCNSMGGSAYMGAYKNQIESKIFNQIVVTSN